MKRALFLSHVPPYPEVGGDRLRISQSLRLLGEVCKVDVAFISHDLAEQSVKEHYSGVENEYCFYASPLRRYARALRTVADSRPEAVNHFDDSRLRRFILDHADDYDLLYCASPVMAQYAPLSKAPRKVLDMTDSLTMNYVRAAAATGGLCRLFYREEARRMRRYEEWCFGQFDSIAYISEADAAYVPGGKKVLVGNAIQSVAAADRCEYQADAQEILFVGKMDYEPNVRAVEFFAREVMPKLKQLKPDVRFVIAGASPSSAVRALAQLPGVEVTGFVPSLAPYYRRCALVVAPMLSGSGVQNKILQALAAGCCVATSPTGREGIECLSDVLTLVEPFTPDAWAERVAALLSARERIRQLGKASVSRVDEEFGLSGVRRQFGAFINL